MPRGAKLVPVQDRDDRLKPEFLRCRTWGHVWDTFAPTHLPPPPYGWRESVRCTRCVTERHRLVDRKGEIMGVKYDYPDGYLLVAGTGRLVRADLRVSLFEELRGRLEQANAISADFGIVVPLKARKGA